GRRSRRTLLPSTRLFRSVPAIPDYQAMFAAAYPEIAGGRPVGFTDISNAIAAFVAFEWRSDNSPFDVMQRGGGTLAPEAQAGMRSEEHTSELQSREKLVC